jgi:hypothetical protein
VRVACPLAGVVAKKATARKKHRTKLDRRYLIWELLNNNVSNASNTDATIYHNKDGQSRVSAPRVRPVLKNPAPTPRDMTVILDKQKSPV